MPGWHESTVGLLENGQLNVLGIVEEQHPVRASLFMQWKQMNWPVAVDAMNLLEMKAVPVTLLLDRNGVIISVSPKRDDIGKLLESLPGTPDIGRDNPWMPWIEMAEKDFLANASHPQNLDTIIESLQKRLAAQDASDPRRPLTHFRLGVAAKARDESALARPKDFALAIQSWESALALDPNQYIWRRRIQQYGPRLDKPYPFYDWCLQAITDITDRGDTPIISVLVLTESELASPGQDRRKQDSELTEPDPSGLLAQPDMGTIESQVLVIPQNPDPGTAIRVHVRLQLTTPDKVSWNNESDPTVLWIPGDSPKLLTWTHYPTDKAYSSETRSFDFEWVTDESGQPEIIQAYCVANLCDQKSGRCYAARIPVHVRIAPSSQ